MADVIPTEQLLELLSTMKTILEQSHNSPAGIEEVRKIINTHPQLPYGLIKTMVSLDIVDQDAFQRTLAANLQQQQAATVGPPSNPPVAPSGPRGFQGPPSGGPRQAGLPQGYQPPPPAPYSVPSQPARASAYPPVPQYPPQVAPQPPMGYDQPAAPQVSLPPAAMHLPEDQKAVVMRVLALTPAQIANLPPAERTAFTQIRQQLLGPGA